MIESRFQARLIKDLQELYPNSIILKNDPNYLQGFPDLTILFDNGSWGVLEDKADPNSRRRPNQAYYIDILSQRGFASFINPENKESVLYELQRSYQAFRMSRFLKRE